MNSINSNFDLPNQPEYFKNFWDYARGREDSDAFLEAGKKPSGSYVLPTSSATKYDEALKRESLFRTIGTYVYSHKDPSKLLGKHTTDAAAWVPDGEAIPIYDGINDFTEFAMEDHKLAAILRMDASFLQDNPHVFGITSSSAWPGASAARRATASSMGPEWTCPQASSRRTALPLASPHPGSPSTM